MQYQIDTDKVVICIFGVFLVEVPKFVLENELRLLDCGMFSEVLRQAGYADEVRVLPLHPLGISSKLNTLDAHFFRVRSRS